MPGRYRPNTSSGVGGPPFAVTATEWAGHPGARGVPAWFVRRRPTSSGPFFAEHQRVVGGVQRTLERSAIHCRPAD